MMHPQRSQLCDRARQLASVRVDGELSELENALLEAHLGRCPGCGAFVDDLVDISAALRNVALERLDTPVVVTTPRRIRRARVLQAGLAAALVIAAAALGSVVNLASRADNRPSPSAQRHTAMLAFADPADQLRRLRRPALVPRNRAMRPETV